MKRKAKRRQKKDEPPGTSAYKTEPMQEVNREIPQDDIKRDSAPDTGISFGEKRFYRKDETDEQDSDGSANAFEGK